MIRRLLALPCIALVTICGSLPAFSKDIEDLEMKDLIAAKQPRLNAPPPTMPGPDKLVAPAGETTTWPIRGDGQPYILSVDQTVNWTECLNEYYFNPKWRGETWGPFQMEWIPERAVLMMPTYQDYDQFSIYHIFNGFHKFWEKYSGYGP